LGRGSCELCDLFTCRYVEPLVENVTQLRNHRKFQEGDTNTVSKFIRQQLSQQGNAAAGAYCVAIDAARPGTGCIAYGAGGPESSIYREWFNITPKGECGCASADCCCHSLVVDCSTWSAMLERGDQWGGGESEQRPVV
jgi:hypothetical protein